MQREKSPGRGAGGAWGRGFHPVMAQRAKCAPRPFRSCYLVMLSIVGCHWGVQFFWREFFETRVLVFGQETEQRSRPRFRESALGFLQNYDANGSGSGLRSLTG